MSSPRGDLSNEMTRPLLIPKLKSYEKTFLQTLGWLLVNTSAIFGQHLGWPFEWYMTRPLLTPKLKSYDEKTFLPTLGWLLVNTSATFGQHLGWPFDWYMACPSYYPLTCPSPLPSVHSKVSIFKFNTPRNVLYTF